MSGNKPAITDKIRQKQPWVPEEIRDTDKIPTGDMPGDKVKIGPQHIQKSRVIFPKLLELLIPALESNPNQRAVVVVCGGSGVGKSEIASLISHYLNRMGVGSYTLSGDNYPHRIPKYNDAERLRVFRQSGINGLISQGQYLEGRPAILKELQASGGDSNPECAKTYPWLSLYQSAGRGGLKNYLGTTNEIDFKELSGIVAQFKNGASSIFLKRMGREETELWYEPVDFRDKHILVIEWTHGNNHNLQGVDVPILLNSTPQETLEHRRSRNRDGATDSPFTTMVLAIEQEMLVSQAPNAKLILSKSGELLTYRDFVKLTLQEQA
jgi:alpha-galactosidase